ncbi:MAG: ATP-dependent sacrificial sulfur transferase LarE [Deltaproteobacteria bacterium]|nr:ATP-dependent sacrificial sulfur transferase LarE [Deltaproteobacteria bacterium]
MDKEGARSKKEQLLSYLEKLDSLVVAFSGGVDSAFLLSAAREALGNNVVAATASSPLHPLREQHAAVRFAEERNIHLVLFQTNEIEIQEVIANGIDRCYHCKHALSEKLVQIAGERGIHHVAHGANMDDMEDYRPGLKAAEEAGIIAPLIDVHLTKGEIRFLAKEMGLPQWDKPSMACLATRFPYGRVITEKGLKMIEAAEEFLSDEGFLSVRVRHHGPVARIEVIPSELSKMVTDDTRKAIVTKFRRIGFHHVSLDLEGYISGKMNRGIETEHPHINGAL